MFMLKVITKLTLEG